MYRDNIQSRNSNGYSQLYSNDINYSQHNTNSTVIPPPTSNNDNTRQRSTINTTSSGGVLHRPSSSVNVAATAHNHLNNITPSNNLAAQAMRTPRWLLILGCIGITCMLLVAVMGQYQTPTTVDDRDLAATVPIDAIKSKTVSKHNDTGEVDNAVNDQISVNTIEQVQYNHNIDNTAKQYGHDGTIHISSIYDLHLCGSNQFIEPYDVQTLKLIESSTELYRQQLYTSMRHLPDNIQHLDLPINQCPQPQSYSSTSGDFTLCYTTPTYQSRKCNIVNIVQNTDYSMEESILRDSLCTIHTYVCDNINIKQSTSRLSINELCLGIDHTYNSVMSSLDTTIDIMHFSIHDNNQLFNTVSGWSITTQLPNQLVIAAHNVSSINLLEYILMIQYVFDIGYRIVAVDEDVKLDTQSITAIKFACIQ